MVWLSWESFWVICLLKAHMWNEFINFRPPWRSLSLKILRSFSDYLFCGQQMEATILVRIRQLMVCSRNVVRLMETRASPNIWRINYRRRQRAAKGTDLRIISRTYCQSFLVFESVDIALTGHCVRGARSDYAQSRTNDAGGQGFSSLPKKCTVPKGNKRFKATFAWGRRASITHQDCQLQW